ncbi:NUDIX hydrolase [Alteribacter lacisalsi]|uniref:NUDIX hydrolase n=1 Tax=Alteribacter lacisalsi TaxID=2045244 RepID=A0A2W0H9J0_9BACI|nr:NUDIX domain-containing protein [Alteribacter lacisalsi]PYZ97787.1 NUDIX hydrolase [Alteribacter lacisalsi]
MSEILKTFNKNQEQTGTAPRVEVHRKGLWHETFHCWFVTRKDEGNFLCFQLRSSVKQDYPSLLDITAAGHLLADESPEDGVREVEEETGIKVAMKELVSLGTIALEDPGGRDGFTDNEFAHTYLCIADHLEWECFSPQPDEVAGFYRASIQQLLPFFKGDISSLRMEGFRLCKNGLQVNEIIEVKKTAFVPHGNSYFMDILQRIEQAVLRF